MTHTDRIVATGAVLGALGVAFGAFGAHALEDRLTADALETFRTGVRYQLWHALAVLAVGILAGQRARDGYRLVAALFTVGTLLFSGSLYLLVLTGVRGFGMMTPLGGLSLLAGWGLLALVSLRRPRDGGGTAH